MNVCLVCRKDYVKKELKKGKEWEKKWGFLPGKYQEVKEALWLGNFGLGGRGVN